jgi:hypothetical protein
VYKDGSICGYLYDDRGFAKATELPETHIAEEEAKHFAALMFQAADRAEKYDKTISQLDFDCEFEPGVLRLMEVYGGEE